MTLFLEQNELTGGLYIPGPTNELLLRFNARDGYFSFGKTEITDESGNPISLRVLLVGIEKYYGDYYEYIGYDFVKVAVIPLARIEKLNAQIPCVYTFFLRGDSRTNFMNALREAPTIKMSPSLNVAILSSKPVEKTSSTNQKVRVKPLFMELVTPIKQEGTNIAKYTKELQKPENSESVTKLLNYNSGLNIVRLDGENDAEIKKQFNIARENNKELFSVDDFNNGDIKALPASTY